MRHPLQAFPPGPTRWAAFGPLLAVTLALAPGAGGGLLIAAARPGRA